MTDFSFILTKRCDWNCKYCDSKSQKEPEIEVFQKHLPYIKQIFDKLNGMKFNVDIQGGEVGTIPLDILRYFFKTMDRSVIVSTNGEFLRRKYHLDKDIRPFIELIMWHVSDDMSAAVNDYKNDMPISKGIVHDNVDEMVEFIKRNDHINFDYLEFEFDIHKERKMDVLMYHDLLNKIKDIPNVTDNARQILYSRLSEDDNLRDKCKNYNGSICIDMVDEKICICQRQLDDCIDLNRHNLIQRLLGFPKDFFEGRKCNTCTRLYAGKMQGKVIESSMLVRSILK